MKTPEPRMERIPIDTNAFTGVVLFKIQPTLVPRLPTWHYIGSRKTLLLSLPLQTKFPQYYIGLKRSKKAYFARLNSSGRIIGLEDTTPMQNIKISPLHR